MSVQIKSANPARKMRRLLAVCGLAVLGLPAVSNAASQQATLDTLLGEDNPGIRIGDKLYHNFTFSQSTPNSPDINARDINVRVSNTGNPQQYTLQFTFGFDAFPGERLNDVVIGYDLDVVGSNDFMNRVGLRFNGSVPAQGTGAAFAAVNESVSTLDGSDLTSVTGGPPSDTEVLDVFNDGSGPGADTNSDFLPINLTRRLRFTKDIIVSSDTNGGYAVISVVDNIVDQVPEPGTLAVIGIAGGAMLLRRRRP